MRDFRDYLKEKLMDRAEAASYLNVALEEYEKDNDADAFLLALRTVTEANGGISELAQKTRLNRQHLYRSLSNRGNPRLITFETDLHALGFRFSIFRVYFLIVLVRDNTVFVFGKSGDKA